METFTLTSEYIQLNQLLKAMNWCNDGGQANMMIDDGLVKVNGVVELRRRNKITSGTIVELDGQKVKVISAEE